MPGFSIQNLREFVPLVLMKGQQLSDRWTEMLREENEASSNATEETVSVKAAVTKGSLVLDVCHWISRATFDVIGLAGKSFWIF